MTDYPWALAIDSRRGRGLLIQRGSDVVDPPIIGISDDQALCPPTEPAAYMQWLKDNREALWRFFGFEAGEGH